jgi:hypothetical protein
MTDPFPIGVLTITAGTPIALATLAGSAPSAVKTLILNNTGTSPIYLGISTMVKATLAGVIDIIQPAERYTIGGYKTSDDISWGGFYIDGDNNGDKLLVSGQTIS